MSTCLSLAVASTPAATNGASLAATTSPSGQNWKDCRASIVSSSLGHDNHQPAELGNSFTCNVPIIQDWHDYGVPSNSSFPKLHHELGFSH
jgi:hypothetical protein